jgi:hypothetical protein
MYLKGIVRGSVCGLIWLVWCLVADSSGHDNELRGSTRRGGGSWPAEWLSASQTVSADGQLDFQILH